MKKSHSQRILVEWAKAHDNEHILRLAHRCYQEGMITLYPDRSPVFNRIHHQLDPESYHVIAKAGEETVGLLGILHQDLYLGNKPFKTAYFLDFKVAPEYRQGLTAFRLARAVIEHELKDHRKMGLATLLRGNRAVEVFTSGRVGFPASVNLGSNVVWNFIPLRKLKPDPQFSIEIPGLDDIPQLVELYNRYYSSYRLAPRMTEELLRYYVTEIEGLGLGHFRMVRKGGRIIAVMALWDEEPYKRFMVIRRNMQIQIMNLAIRILGLLFSLPAPVKRNRPLRQKTVVLYAHDGSADAIGALLKHANNELRGSGFTLFQMFVHEQDPVNQHLKGLTKIPVYSDIHLFTDTEELADEVRDTPGLVHLEFPMYV